MARREITMRCGTCRQYSHWRCLSEEMPPIPYHAWPDCAWYTGDAPDEGTAPTKDITECDACALAPDVNCCNNNNYKRQYEAAWKGLSNATTTH